MIETGWELHKKGQAQLRKLKPLSHQDGVLTAISRRPRQTQNAAVGAVGSPWAPTDRRGISIGRRGIS